MQATSRLLLGLPVRLLVGGPQMPKNARPAAASLSPSRRSYRGRRGARVHRPIAPGRSSLPVPREPFHPSVPTLRNLASHPLRRLRSCLSQRGDNAGSIARHTVSKWRSRQARNFFVLTRSLGVHDLLRVARQPGALPCRVAHACRRVVGEPGHCRGATKLGARPNHR